MAEIDERIQEHGRQVGQHARQLAQWSHGCSLVGVDP
jgi:hypothetical protein